jgi:hypothetical protein
MEVLTMATKPKQTDLSEDLFRQLHRLLDSDLTGEKLTEEIARSKAAAEMSAQIIANGALVLSACRMAESASRSVKMPLLLSEE